MCATRIPFQLAGRTGTEQWPPAWQSSSRPTDGQCRQRRSPSHLHQVSATRSFAPNLMTSMITPRMFLLAREVAGLSKRLESRSLSKIGDKWSAVLPDGPAAVPRRDFRRQVNNISPSKLNGCSGSHLSISWLNPRLGFGGLLSGSVKARRVARVPGTTDAPSRACLAADNSPRLTRHRARIAPLSTISSRW